MNRHALQVLEFDVALDVVAGHASSRLGGEAVRALAPSLDRLWIEMEQDRVSAVRTVIASERGWPTEPIPDARAALQRVRVEGTVLAPAELLSVAVIARSSESVARALADDRAGPVVRGVLFPHLSRLASVPPIERAVSKAIDADGNVADEASPALRRIRRDLRGTEGDLVKLLERLMSRLDAQHQVSDMSVTVRNGRFVIPVRREGRSTLGGIVHDTSSTGATLFVEPPAAVEAGNRIRELEADEQREVARILAELSELIRPSAVELADSLDALVALDALYARARYTLAAGCNPVEFTESGGSFAIFGGRHPILLAQGGDVVPFDLEMDAEERTLLISGPNTGGKTVLLKSLGLFAALAQSGVPVPVAKETRLAIFDEVFADIGDEQSIASSLSTFSAHLRNLKEIVGNATGDSLVLIDELGSGTDPVEGAAIGGAILEALTRRGTLSIATTHLGALKELAAEVPGVVNASLQFDGVALAPTYRLIKGIPGRSYGISIARRLGMPEEILARAEERLPSGEKDINTLLGSLQEREATIGKRELEVAAAEENISARTDRVVERDRDITARERDIERHARRESRRFLLDARAEVDRAISELKATTSADAADSAGRAARRHVEELAAGHAEALDRMDQRPDAAAGDRQATFGEIQPGSVVEVSALGGRVGRVIEVRGTDCVVAVGSVKLTVSKASLRRSAADEVAVTVPIRGDLPEVDAPSEIDLRGMRVTEVDDILMYALDAAIRADHKALRIIHGKGTGALRERVSEMLRKETRVTAFRLGAWNEGGAGVTVVELT